jgi:hypothetical protein
LSTLVHYYAAVAYDRAGLVGDAITEYEHFLSFCSDADPEFEGVSDARERLKKLKQGL